MSATEFFGYYGAIGLLTFYWVSRLYTLRLRRGELGKGKDSWDPPGVFCFAMLMGVIWPLGLLYQLARRESKEERKLASQQRALKLEVKNARRAREVLEADEGANSSAFGNISETSAESLPGP